MFSGWYDMYARPTDMHQGRVITEQRDWELMEIVKIYRQLAPKTVLEIGSRLGGTLWYWIKEAQPGTVICNIDDFESVHLYYEKVILPARWKRWTAMTQVELHTLAGRSDDPLIQELAFSFIKGSIDFLFIDADHSYEAVWNDFADYGPCVKTGGIIALHDIRQQDSRPNYGVWKLWDEIKRAGYKTQELKVDADGRGIGVIYV